MGLLTQGEEAPARGVLPPEAPTDAPAPPTGDALPGMTDASPEEQKIYDAALELLGQQLYGNDELNDRIVSLFTGGSHMEAIGDTVSMLIIRADEQIDLPDGLIIPLMEELAAMVIDMIEEGGVAEISDRDKKEGVALATKILMEHYGVDEEEMELAVSRTGEMSDDDPTAVQIKEMMNGQ